MKKAIIFLTMVFLTQQLSVYCYAESFSDIDASELSEDELDDMFSSLEETVDNDVEGTVSTLNSDLETLITDIDTFE